MPFTAVASIATFLGTAGADIGAALGGSAIADAVGAGLVDAATGAVLGGVEGQLTGEGFGKGAEGGAIAGGVLGLGAPALESMGLGVLPADLLAGAAGGALGGKATGGNPLTGALLGGAAGGASALLSGAGGVGGGGGTSSAAGAAAPAGAAPTAAAAIDTASATPAVFSDTSGIGVGGGITAPTASAPDFSSSFGSPASGSLTAPVASTLPGDVGAGAASGAPSALAPANSNVSLGAPQTAIGAGDGSITSSATLPSLSTATPSIGGGAGGGGASSGFGSLFKNPVTDIALGGFALDALQANKKPPFYNQLAATAQADANQSKLMEGYLTSGTLPPGLQASVNAASDSAMASIRQMYASRGMSGSSAEKQDLENAQMRTQAQASQIAMQLFQQGLSESQISDNLFQILMNESIQQDQQLGQGIGNLVGALALQSRPIAA